MGRQLGRFVGSLAKAEYSEVDLLNVGWHGSGGATGPKGQVGWLLAYARNPRLAAAIRRIARDVGKQRWHLSRVITDKEGKVIQKAEIFRHDFLTVWNRPHPRMSGAKFRGLAQLYLEACGEAFIVARCKPGSIKPYQLWLIPPHWVIETPTSDYQAYKVALPTHAPPGEEQPIWDVPTEMVLWLTDPDPYDPYARGLGVARCLDDEVSQDEWAAKWNNSFFRNGARPDAIVSVLGADKTAREKLKADWEQRHQGFWNAFKVAFLAGDAKVSLLGRSHQELDFYEGRRSLRDIIFQTFGLSPEVMGVVENSNRATADAGLYLHSLNVVEPRLEYFCEEVNHWLLPRWGDETLVAWYESPVRETEEFRLNKALEAFSRGVITRNECRRELAWNEFTDERGEEILAPSNMTIVMPGANTGGANNKKERIILGRS